MNIRYLLPFFALLWAGFAHPPAAERGVSAGPASFVAPQDEALVVFVRPSKIGMATNYYVYDENKQLLTLFKGKRHATTAVQPGKHTFYVVAWNAALVRAEVAAGRTYIIRTDPARAGTGVVARPVLRRSADFWESAQWIHETRPAVPDFEKGKKWTRKHQKALDSRIARAESKWSSTDRREQLALTMGIHDGRTAKEASKL